MAHTLLLTGDINLMNAGSPEVPFRLVAPVLHGADFVFSNLECCFYVPPARPGSEPAGFRPDPVFAEALKIGGIHAVGIANNVNYGEADIKASIARLDELGILHTGAGADRAAAKSPVILERDGLRIGFLQRTSVYWPNGHEAGENSAGVAVIRGHTAYQLPLHKTRREVPPANRPGIPPVVVTWADRDHLGRFQQDIAALREEVDIVVASCHWGLWQDILEYMTEIAHAAIDAGADVVMGHGPHFSLPIEIYRGCPIFYGLGSFSFHTGHSDGVAVGDWVGMLVRIEIEDSAVAGASFRFVRHNSDNETVLCQLRNEAAIMEDLTTRSAQLGARLTAQEDEVAVVLGG